VRVAVVFPGIDAEQGGGFTYARTLVDAVRAEEASCRHEFLFYTAQGAAPPEGFEVRRIPSGRVQRWRKGAIRLLRAVQDLAAVTPARRGWRTWFERSLEEEGVDMVWFATNYAEECDPPFIFTPLDLAHREQPWYPEVSQGGIWERRQHHYSRFLGKAAAVVVPSSAGEAEVKRHFSIGEARILRLPHPTPTFALQADDTIDRRSVLERYDIHEPYVFYPAQYWAHKNHYTLLETIAELERRGRPFTAVCAGADHGQLDHVRALADELGVEDRVRLLGFVELEELIALYRHAHALVFLSLFGPENLPPLEAFALRCPVIAGDVAGAREQMGDAALLVSATDPREVADAVERLDDDGLRTRLCDLGRPRAEERSAEAYVQGVVEFLDDFEPVRRSWPMHGGSAS
jgi:glycosyltransferase involved in cell wall biosynthesis